MDDYTLMANMIGFSVSELITFFFCLTLFFILKRIPKENQQFPSWALWLFLIPIVGYIIQWIMLPFSIPTALKKTFANNQDAIQSADTLMKVGLGQVICALFGFLPIAPLNQYMSWVGVLLWAVYWFLIMRFKKTYMTA